MNEFDCEAFIMNAIRAEKKLAKHFESSIELLTQWPAIWEEIKELPPNERKQYLMDMVLDD